MIPPGSSVYVKAPEVLKVTVLPEHKILGVAERIDTTGAGTTFTEKTVGSDVPQVYVAVTDKFPLTPEVAVILLKVLVPTQPFGNVQP